MLHGLRLTQVSHTVPARIVDVLLLAAESGFHASILTTLLLNVEKGAVESALVYRRTTCLAVACPRHLPVAAFRSYHARDTRADTAV